MSHNYSDINDSEYREPIKVIADILQQELGLASGRVMLIDQKFNIPTDEGLFITLAYLGPGKTIASTNEFDGSVSPPVEIQSVTSQEQIQIDLKSYNDEARTRQKEIPMALASQYAQRQMEKYQLQIARQPAPFLDTSAAEMTAELKRYTTTIALTAGFTKTKAAEYYDDFQEPVATLNK